MSFNRATYDDGAYKQQLYQSVGVGNYLLGTPNNLDKNCESCYPYPPTVRLQVQGDSLIANTPLIDVDSELLGLTRPLSKDPSQKYVPCCPGAACKGGLPCGGGVLEECTNCKQNLKRGQRATDSNLKHFKDCFFPEEFTRLSNGPSTLRGTGWNRWEWLCINPQERVEVPFDFNISARTLSKDNHRPCVPNPIDPSLSLPPGGSLSGLALPTGGSIPTTLPCINTSPVCGNYTTPSPQWRSCQSIRNY